MKLIAIAAALASLAVAPASLATETSQSTRSATEAAAAVQLKKGDVLYSSSGRRLGSVYRVTPEGDAQVIIQSRMVTVPAAVISEVDGKLVASVASSKELLRGR
jgi:hypothetical protein